MNTLIEVRGNNINYLASWNFLFDINEEEIEKETKKKRFAKAGNFTCFTHIL